MRHRLPTWALSGLLSLGILASGMGPVAAGALQAGGAVSGSLTRSVSGQAENTRAGAEVQKVGSRRHYRGGRHFRGGRHYRGARRYSHRRFHRPRARSGIHLHFGTQRYVRPRYVRPRYRAPRALSVSHVRWCHDRYRSYRQSDNTFQPYNGPRKACVSPYL